MRIISKFLALACFLLLAGMVSFHTTAAQAASEAHGQLEATINQVLNELKKPELKNPATRDAVLANVEGIIGRLFDFEELSSRTVGASWQNFSADQKSRFIASFTMLLRETYLEKLDGYNGETVSYVGESASTKGDKVEIKTSVNIRNKPVPVAYRMLHKGNWVVYDVIIEGVSMVQNYRSQFQGLLTKGDAEQLISQVELKAQEARAHNRKQQTGK